jgi:hypothetical protein
VSVYVSLSLSLSLCVEGVGSGLIGAVCMWLVRLDDGPSPLGLI